MTFVPNPGVMLKLTVILNQIAEEMVDEIVIFLKEKLSGEGSGIKWPQSPNRSSSPGEYPAEQTGDLLNSIGYRQVNLGRFEVGSLEELGSPKEAWDLEFPPSGNVMEGRQWLSKAFGDNEMHMRIMARLGKFAGVLNR